MNRDPVVAEVRRVREELYAESGSDLRQFLDRIRELEQQNAARMITLSQLNARRRVAHAASPNRASEAAT